MERFDNGMVLGCKCTGMRGPHVFFPLRVVAENKERVRRCKEVFYYGIPVVAWNLIELLIEKGGRLTLPEDITSLGIVPTFTNADKPLWFLDELAWFSLFLPIIKRIPAWARGCIAVLALASIYLWSPEAVRSYSMYPKFAADCSLFLLGTLLSGCDILQVTRHFMKIAPWICALSVFYVWRGVFSIGVEILQPWTPAYAVAGVLAILSYGATIERLVPRAAKMVAGLAPAVFFIYAAHWPLFTLWGKIEEQYGIARLGRYSYPLYAVACFLICILLWVVARKYMPGKILECLFLCKKGKPQQKA